MHRSLLSALAITIALVLSSSASALELSRTLSASDIAQPPNEVRFLIYDGPDVAVPMEFADFGPGQYWLEEQGDQIAISAELLQDLDPRGLWIETELDGQIKGERVELRVATPGITFAQSLDMDGNTITNLAAPLADSEAATKSYVDSADTTGNAATAAALAADGANCDPGHYALGVDAQGAAQGCTQESSDITGNAATATALAADGANCDPGYYALGVDAQGAAQGCTQAPSASGDNLGNHIATQSLGMANNSIVELAGPTAGTDAANKAYVDSADTTGNAATATALAADGSDCPTGQYARGVTASGAASGCAPAPALNPDDGDMQYWDGTAWVLISAASADADQLSLCNGVPTWTATGCIHYAIGDTGPGGGKVFYITHGGYHGLEAAPDDQTSSAWGCSGTAIPGASGTTVGTGAQNTGHILIGCATPGIAARVAVAYTLTTFTDWFLPSKDELNLMYQQKNLLGGFTGTIYWSSSEFDSFGAWAQSFNNGNQMSLDKNITYKVRPVRAF